MSLKSEIKMSVLHEQGVKADDNLEAAHKRMSAHDGAKQALRLIAKSISSLAAVVDRDVEDGKLPVDEPAQVASYVKLMIDRAVNSAISAAQHQENLQLSVSGEIVAYKAMVDSIQKELNLERSRVQAIQQAVASGEISVEGGSPTQSDSKENQPRDRPVGVRPGLSIAAQRRAEDMVAPAGEVSLDENPDKKPKKKRKDD